MKEFIVFYNATVALFRLLFISHLLLPIDFSITICVISQRRGKWNCIAKDGRDSIFSVIFHPSCSNIAFLVTSPTSVAFLILAVKLLIKTPSDNKVFFITLNAWSKWTLASQESWIAFTWNAIHILLLSLTLSWHLFTKFWAFSMDDFSYLSESKKEDNDCKWSHTPGKKNTTKHSALNKICVFCRFLFQAKRKLSIVLPIRLIWYKLKTLTS